MRVPVSTVALLACVLVAAAAGPGCRTGETRDGERALADVPMPEELALRSRTSAVYVREYRTANLRYDTTAAVDRAKALVVPALGAASWHLLAEGREGDAALLIFEKSAETLRVTLARRYGMTVVDVELLPRSGVAP